MKNIVSSNIVTAFNSGPIGTKVLDAKGFNKVLEGAIDGYDWSSCRVPGQGFIVMPEMAPFVSSGDGERTKDVRDYEPHYYRGKVRLFLKRRCAGKATLCACVVYTVLAYLDDPDVQKDEAEMCRVVGASHVLVAILANSGPDGPLTPDGLIHNLAGGNKEALTWSADEIRAKAKGTEEYWDKYAVVAG